MARLESLPQSVQFGKYQLTDRIAVGRMGEVFRAKRDGVEGFEKILVVKRLFAELSSNSQFVTDFVDEAKLTVSLSHANIVQVLDLGHQENAYFMAMEYVPGYDLGSIGRILRVMGRPFPLDIAVFIVSEVAKGLDYAHRRKDYNFESLNIVHRDLTPANVLISFEGEVKISDFGISRALETLGSTQQDLRRRFMHASPEQARGEQLTHHSDIFCLGLILYQLVSGRHPYDDPNPNVVQEHARMGTMRPIAEVADLPRALEQIINSTLAVRPEERIDSAGTLYEELISYLFASGQKADNRSLSLFMQELRPYEDQAFEAPQVRVPDASDASAVEIDAADIEEVQSASMDPLPLPGWQAQPRSTIDRMASAVDGRSSGPQGSGSPAHMTSLGPGVPGRISEVAGGLRSGVGGALALVGALGRGREFLPDRLPQTLTEAGLTVISMSAMPDDRTTPYSLASHIIRILVGLPSGREFGGPTASFDQALDALDMLTDHFGAEPAEHQIALSLCGLTGRLNKGFHTKRDLTLRLIERLMDALGADGPACLLVSGVEYIDVLSGELLVSLAHRCRTQGLLIVLSTSTGNDVKALGCFAGHDEVIESVAVAGRPSTVDAHAVVVGLDPVAREVMSTLVLAERPVSVGVLSEIAGSGVHLAIEGLEHANALRFLDGDFVLPATPSVRDLMFETAGSGGTLVSPRLFATKLLDLADVSSRSGTEGPWASARVRLLAWLGDRQRARALVMSGSHSLSHGGWREISQEYLASAGSVYARSGIGDPQSEIDFQIERAWVAISLMQLDLAREIIVEASERARAVGDDLRTYSLLTLEARLAAFADDIELSRSLYSDALLGAKRLGSPAITSRASLGLARWQCAYGNLHAAEEHVGAVLNLIEHHHTIDRDAESTSRSLRMMVDVLAQRGQIDRASSVQRRLEDMAAQTSSAALQCRVVLGQAHIMRATASPSQAASDAEVGYNLAREHNLICLGLLLALEVAEASLDGGDLERTRAYGAHLAELGERYADRYLQRRGADLAHLAGVLAPGAGSLDSLQGLNAALKRAQQTAVPRDNYNAHLLLFRALTHLGSGSDADHHRQQAQHFALLCGADGRAARLAEH